MSIIKVDNTIDEIQKTIKELIEIYKDIALVSYIDGELGIRAMIYSTIVSNFVNTQKILNNTVIGVCFKGYTFYVKHLYDVVIEIQGSVIQNNRELPETVKCHDMNVYTCNYNGTDGWNPFYNCGFHHEDYEKLLHDCVY